MDQWKSKPQATRGFIQPHCPKFRDEFFRSGIVFNTGMANGLADMDFLLENHWATHYTPQPTATPPFQSHVEKQQQTKIICTMPHYTAQEIGKENPHSGKSHPEVRQVWLDKTSGGLRFGLTMEQGSMWKPLANLVNNKRQEIASFTIEDTIPVFCSGKWTSGSQNLRPPEVLSSHIVPSSGTSFSGQGLSSTLVWPMVWLTWTFCLKTIGPHITPPQPTAIPPFQSHVEKHQQTKIICTMPHYTAQEIGKENPHSGKSHPEVRQVWLDKTSGGLRFGLVMEQGSMWKPLANLVNNKRQEIANLPIPVFCSGKWTSGSQNLRPPGVLSSHTVPSSGTSFSGQGLSSTLVWPMVWLTWTFCLKTIGPHITHPSPQPSPPSRAMWKKSSKPR